MNWVLEFSRKDFIYAYGPAVEEHKSKIAELVLKEDFSQQEAEFLKDIYANLGNRLDKYHPDSTKEDFYNSKTEYLMSEMGYYHNDAEEIMRGAFEAYDELFNQNARYYDVEGLVAEKFFELNEKFHHLLDIKLQKLSATLPQELTATGNGTGIITTQEVLDYREDNSSFDDMTTIYQLFKDSGSVLVEPAYLLGSKAGEVDGYEALAAAINVDLADFYRVFEELKATYEMSQEEIVKIINTSKEGYDTDTAVREFYNYQNNHSLFMGYMCEALKDINQFIDKNGFDVAVLHSDNLQEWRVVPAMHYNNFANPVEGSHTNATPEHLEAVKNRLQDLIDEEAARLEDKIAEDWAGVIDEYLDKQKNESAQENKPKRHK